MNRMMKTSPINMTTITPPLILEQRLPQEVIFSKGISSISTNIQQEMNEQMVKQQITPNQLSLPLAVPSQRDSLSGEHLIRSPIKVDVRVQFIPKSDKSKTKKVKYDQSESD